MSPSGAGRRRHRGPASPPESSSAGRRPDTRRPASSTGSLDLCAARAGTGAGHGVLRLRRGLLRVVLLLPLLLAASLWAREADAQTVQPSVSFTQDEYVVWENAGTVTVTVRLLNILSASTTVRISATGNTATASTGTTVDGDPVPATADFLGFTNVDLTIPAGSLSASHTITILNDTAYENGNWPKGEEFSVSVVSVNGDTSLGGAAAKVIIADEEYTFCFDSKTYLKDESAGVVSLPLRLSRPVPFAVTVTSTFVDYIATQGVDYDVVKGTHTYQPGGSLDGDFKIRIHNDSDDERNELFRITALVPAVPDGEAECSTDVIIRDDDDAPVLSIEAPADADEGDSATTDRLFTVRLSKPVAKAFTYKVCFSGTASRDLTRAATIPVSKDYRVVVNSNVTVATCSIGLFAARATSSTQLGIRVKGDTDREGDETVVATLSIEGYTNTIALGVELGTSTATHTIRGDDRRVLSIEAPADADEGDTGTTDRLFTVRLSKPVAKAFTYKVCFSGTASRDLTRAATIPVSKDYRVVVNSNVTVATCSIGLFAARATSSTQLGIRVKGDTDREGDETVVATLSIEGYTNTIALGVELGTSTATHTIRGDDRRVLSIEAPADADEGDSATTDRLFTVRLSKPVAKAFTYKVCFSGTASRDLTRAATIPVSKDYRVVVNSNVTVATCSIGLFAARATSSTQLGIRVKGDTDREGDETVVATLGRLKAIPMPLRSASSWARPPRCTPSGATTGPCRW